MKLLLLFCVVLCVFPAILSANVGNSRILNGMDGYIVSCYVGIGYARVVDGSEVRRVGGTLITPRHVLTVASIIRSYVQWHVYTGAMTTPRLTTLNAAFHEGYVNNTSGTARNNDIGIIFFDKDVPEATPGLLPDISITLATPNTALDITIYGKGEIEEGTPATTVKTSMTRISTNSQCSFMSFTSANFFCANDAYTNICAGDVGGPVTQVIANKITVVGIAAATGGCVANGGSLFTNIYPYRKWINGMTNDGLHR